MKVDELLPMWLTDRRDGLLADARKAERAYTRGPLRVDAAILAAAHREAAAVYDRHLKSIALMRNTEREEARRG